MLLTGQPHSRIFFKTHYSTILYIIIILYLCSSNKF
jgi:hypothetical protein